MIDYYELLGINKNANEEQIKSAYRQMAKKYHPDINKTKDANKVIISLNKAKETLLDKKKRHDYDKLLEEINHSKQIAKNNEETYSEKVKEYKKEYQETYITKWNYFIHYLKNSSDNKWKKAIKISLVIINWISFTIIKIITICLTYLVYILENLIDYLAGFIMILGFLYLFISKDTTSTMFLIPTNIQKFILLFFTAIIIETLKIYIIKKSINIYVLFQNLEDKTFIHILTK